MTALRHRAMTLVGVIGGMLMSGAAFACESLVTDGVKRAKTGPDGSYFAQSKSSFVEGRPVVNLGLGRIGQRLRMASDCVEREQLLFVDCLKGEMVVIDGTISPQQRQTQRDNPDTYYFFDTRVEYLQPPHGPIALTPTITVREVAGIADSAGFENTLSPKGIFPGFSIGAKFDPFWGCKTFYPGFAGAQP